MPSPRLWWENVTLTSLEVDALNACKQLCEPVREEPGWFAVRDGVDVRFQGQLLDPNDRPLHFSLVDPDIRGLPFHRTSAFLVVPYQYRFYFLFRNPHCIDALMRLFRSNHALATRRGSEGALIQAGQEGQTFLAAESELRDRFGITAVCNYKGIAFDPPILSLEEAFPDDLPTLGRTVREQRGFRKALAARRRTHGIKAPRRESDDYYKRLLVVWDGREGWEDQPSKGYDPERALSLREAVARAGVGACAEEYYHAFRLITGLEYSKEAWLVTLGVFWLNCKAEAIRRRRTDKKHARRITKVQPVVRFLELVRNGATVAEAVRIADLPEQEALFLSAPENRDAVLAFLQAPERVSELLATM
jgi:hypothetical protein